MMSEGTVRRCAWCGDGGLVQEYHDREWGIPLHDDQKQFEFLMLEAMQCGLSWLLILKKREIFRACFDGFDYERVARYDEAKIQEILETPGMIRSRGKIEAVVGNARCFLKVREEFGSFDQYLWGFTDGKALVYRSHGREAVTENELSREVAKDLRGRGFRYLGPVTVYSHLQACGIINDHDRSCFAYEKVLEGHPVRFIEG